MLRWVLRSRGMASPRSRARTSSRAADTAKRMATPNTGGMVAKDSLMASQVVPQNKHNRRNMPISSRLAAIFAGMGATEGDPDQTLKIL